VTVLERARRWGWRARRKLCRTLRLQRLHSAAAPPRHRRYLSGRSERSETWLQAAREYASRADRAWLYRKPFDHDTGHPAFFDDLYGVMNLLRAMAITPGGKVVEVGSGPGWVTEILLALGYHVDAVEPSEEMIAIARERVADARRHFHLGETPRVSFHAETLESCTLPGDAYDGVFLHAALHHVVDEQRGLAQCFRLLRPGGVLGVSEGAWIPGDWRLEEKLDEEMSRFGTLESPYTVEYLDFVLRRVGFVDIRRYYAVNGLLPAARGGWRIARAATSRPWDSNNLTSRKPPAHARQ